VCVSHFPHFQFFSNIFQFLYGLCLIFHVFQFSCHNPSSTVCISHFSRSSMFLAIFQVKQCVYLIFHIFQYFSNIFQFLYGLSPYSRPYSVHISFSTFFSISLIYFSFYMVFRHTLGHTACISHFPIFECFSTYSRSYSVFFSFSMIFSFLAILQVLECAFLIVHIFECFSPYSRSNSVCVSFCMFFSFLAIFQVLQGAFLIFHVFQCF